MSERNETTRLERVRAFESNHGCGSIGGCPTCLRDFAAQECAALEKENADKDIKIESLTAALAEARESCLRIIEQLHERGDTTTHSWTIFVVDSLMQKLKAAIDAAGGIK